MDNILDAIYSSVDIVDEIKELNKNILRLNSLAKLYANDVMGTDSMGVVTFKGKDITAVKADLADLYEAITDKEEKMREHPIAKMFNAVPHIVPTEHEYQIHDKHTDQMVLHLNPSESLLIINQLLKIYESRRDKLYDLLKDTFPTIQ